ncbi:MAG: hypothetical protein QMD06_00370 [Candidatus Altarchaeum sp.]|nr:hypothetical protein [Candidatus Altarchaeum sp.]
MSRSEEIINKFPNFYKSWDKESTVFKLVSAFGTQLDEFEKDLDGILRSKWVDTSKGKDLEMLGGIYNIHRRVNEPDKDYRNRLKTAIQGFKGGGTINAVLTSLRIMLGLDSKYPLKIIENPVKKIHENIKLKSGETWEMSSKSITCAENAGITIEVNEGDSIKDPKIINMESGDSIAFNGTVSAGEKLFIRDNSAVIGKKDVTDNLSRKTIPEISRKKTKWRYTESLKGKIGVFDSARFDEYVFAVDVSTVSIIFEWTAYQQASFEVQIPKNIIAERGISEKSIIDVLNSVKAAGVNAVIWLI